MLPSKIFLVDRNGPLADAWRAAFTDVASVEVVVGDFFARDADAMVSPANSFGIMDGGLDAAIVDVLGGDLQARVRNAVVSRHHGEIAVGAADIVATGNARWPHLVVAPTMRVPSVVANTVNAFLAFRATLLAVVRHNETSGSPIRSLLVPGLGTGIGSMPASRCAHQMRVAFDQVRAPAVAERSRAILDTHRAMLMA